MTSAPRRPEVEQHAAWPAFDRRARAEQVSPERAEELWRWFRDGWEARFTSRHPTMREALARLAVLYEARRDQASVAITRSLRYILDRYR